MVDHSAHGGATVDDIVPMVVYLLSDESRIVTGQAFLVDGGATI